MSGRLMRSCAAVLLALLVVCVVGPVPERALADADPASDILLGAPVFYPFQPPVSQALQTQIQAELGALQKQGLSLKVAIIESPVDLGALPNLFGHPQTYANFLDQEISFSRPQALLVVMPAGLGLVHAGNPTALAGLTVNNAAKSDGLAQTAITAVQHIAKANGKSLASTSGSNSSSGGSSLLITVGVPVIVVLTALGIIWVRRGGAPDPSPSGPRSRPRR